MADDFDPSPRASKRQRTATYKSQALALEKDAKAKPAAVRKTSRNRLDDNEAVAASAHSSHDKHPPTSNAVVQVQREHASSSPESETVDHAQTDKNPNQATVARTGSLRRARKGRREDGARTNDVDLESSTSRDSTTPGIGGSNESSLEGSANAVQRRMGGYQRKSGHRPGTASNKPQSPMQTIIGGETQPVNDVAQAEKSIRTPKGILTPSKTRTARPSKTVVFASGSRAVEEQFGFKDIDSAVQKTPTAAAARKAQDTREEGGRSSSTPSRRARKNGIEAGATRSSEEFGEVENGVDADDDEIFFDQLLGTEPDTDVAETSVLTSEDELLVVEEDPSYLAVKAQILSRLLQPSFGDVSSFPAHLQTPYSSLYDVLTATITTGESNSLLLLGSRGVGKTLLLNTALKDLGEKHADDFHTVRLNGFIQTDDKLALREIWRQLGREMNVGEDDTSRMASYADTMASLLSVLSHPDEFIHTSMENGTNDHDHDHDHNHNLTGLDTVTAVDADGLGTNKISKSVIFILDEFDLFTTHPRQTLLYNLFDIAQSRKAPIAVIGCSTRMDVVDCLEKRVKSRFSHRWIHVSGPKSLEAFEGMIQTILQINEIRDDAGKQLTANEREARKAWNLDVETLLIPAPAVNHLIKRTFHTTKSVPDLLAALYLSVATLTRSSLHSQAVLSPLFTSAPHPVTLLPSLPTLQLSLLCAAARLDAIHNLSAVNFNLVFDHYVKLVARSKLQQTASGAVAVGAGVRQWTREMAQDAWEDLGSWALIAPALGTAAAAGAGAGGREFSGAAELVGGEGASVRMWKVDVSLDDLSWALKEKAALHGGLRSGPIEILSRWCREI